MAAVRTEIIRDVPEDKKAEREKEYKDLGWNVAWTKQADGKWTLTATKPASGGTGG